MAVTSQLQTYFVEVQNPTLVTLVELKAALLQAYDKIGKDAEEVKRQATLLSLADMAEEDAALLAVMGTIVQKHRAIERITGEILALIRDLRIAHVNLKDDNKLLYDKATSV
jgi:hypothetical protein